MGDVIDSLLISFGLDAGKVAKGVQQIEGYIDTALGAVSGFASGLQEGLTENTAELNEMAEAAGSAGEALQDAGETGSRAMVDVAAKTAQAETRVKSLSERANDLGRNLGGKLKGILTGLAAPMAGMMAVGALIKGYSSDMSELDALTKKTSLSMEERARKQKLLGEYSAKDLEQYRKSQKELDAFSKKLSEGASVIMRAVMPALTWFLGKLTAVADFVVRHQSFFVAFFTLIAAAITAKVIPAIVAMGKAWLANPMVLTIAGLLALVALLALAVDDLWVYMQGGESALSGLWSVFGTGEEISRALADTWETLKAVGVAMWNGLKFAATSFFSYFAPALNAFVNIFKSALLLIKSLFTGNFGDAFAQLENLLNGIADFIVGVFSGAFNLLYDIVVSIFSAIGDFFTGIFDAILGTVTGAIKGIVSKIPSFLLPESLAKWANTVDSTIKDVAPYAGLAVESANGYAALDGVSPASVGGSVANTTEYNTDMGGVNININSTDPAGAARETGNELRRMTATGNKGVNQ